LTPSPSDTKGSKGERGHFLELLVYIKQDCQAYPLPPSGRVTVGRSHRSDIRVEHASVSREHLALYVGEILELEDLGSSNGTMIYRGSQTPSARDREEKTEHSAENRRVTPGTKVRVEVGEMVRIGSVIVTIQRRKITSGYEALRDARAQHTGPAVLVDEQMKRIYELAARAAQSDISVMILGETGVGKEVLAETIHYRSNRAAQPFLRLNCSALSETLLESELFGYERGAFTGANQARVGLLESTDGGTVFLDEIGDLPLTTQVKLLRVLEERFVIRVGGNKARKVDMRFVTATNRDLGRLVALGKFREDLFFRINGVQIRLPPLRDRKSEIEPLARFFLSAFCSRSRVPEPQLTPGAVERMLTYSWPGNVRELKNVMERAPFLCGAGSILGEHVPYDTPAAEYMVTSVDESPENTDVFDLPGLQPPSGADERQRIMKALEACGGNQTRAARLLGVSRRTLINRLEEYNLPRPKKQ
jgi:two-component system response regulator AtoC